MDVSSTSIAPDPSPRMSRMPFPPDAAPGRIGVDDGTPKGSTP
jgi:hypothetical protein